MASLLFLPTLFLSFSTSSFVVLKEAGKTAAESSGAFILALFSQGRCIKVEFGYEEDTLFMITVGGITSALLDCSF